VLITGAARGIGAELARRAAARGARVALVGLEPELLAQVADELGPEHLWVECDVTDAGALEGAVARTVETFGGLDIVVANAGIAPLTTVMTSTAQALSRTIEINLIGAMLTAHAALPEIARRRGHILLVSSAAAFTVLPGMSAYCASKAGVERFGDALRLEVAHRGVTVASAHPTWIDTDLVRDTEAALPTFAETRKRLPGPLGAYTSVEACAQALAENLETRGRRVFVPRSVGTVAALRQLVTGALSEKIMMKAAAARVPQLEADIAALGGRQFGANSVGNATRATPGPAT
jgi:NAD(P)-dependent dehydrogenase (short-subunit alcohol dehydrogenase family)